MAGRTEIVNFGFTVSTLDSGKPLLFLPSSLEQTNKTQGNRKKPFMNQLMANFNIAKDLRNKYKLLSDLFFLCCVKQKVKVLKASHITEYSNSRCIENFS